MLCVIAQPPQFPTFIGFSSHHRGLKSLKDVCIGTQRQVRSLDQKVSIAGLWMLVANALHSYRLALDLTNVKRLFQCTVSTQACLHRAVWSP